MAMDQQAQLNAPDPRETCPPCYEDALLLPRLDGSFASLNELGQKKERKKRVVTQAIISDTADGVEEEVVETRISARDRSRSEEVLSMREIVSNRRSGRYRTPTEEQPNFENHYYANISRGSRKSASRHRIPTSPPPTRIPTPPPDLPPPPPIPGKPTGLFQSNAELHYHSTEILNMLPKQSKQTAPLSPVLSQSSTNSAEYDDLQDFNDSKESPYSRRKSRNRNQAKSLSGDSLPEPDEIILVDNHFLEATPPQNSPKSSSEEGFAVVVQVHRAPHESNL